MDDFPPVWLLLGPFQLHDRALRRGVATGLDCDRQGPEHQLETYTCVAFCLIAALQPEAITMGVALNTAPTSCIKWHPKSLMCILCCVLSITVMTVSQHLDVLRL